MLMSSLMLELQHQHQHQHQHQNVDICPQNIDICPQNINICSQNVDICPQNIDICPQNIDIYPQNIDICPKVTICCQLGQYVSRDKMSPYRTGTICLPGQNVALQNRDNMSPGTKCRPFEQQNKGDIGRHIVPATYCPGTIYVLGQNVS